MRQVVRSSSSGDGSAACILFDEGEKWLLEGDTAVFGAFHVLPVAIHGVGHALGLEHSQRAGDAMSPWYKEELTRISLMDNSRCKALYPRRS